MSSEPSDRGARTRVDWTRTLLRLPSWAKVVLIGVSLAGCWTIVYLAGGSTTAAPHIFYIPILLAALLFGVQGGVVAGSAAAVLCGPMMPLDVATGEAQEAVNWLARGGFYVVMGGASGLSTVSLHRTFRSSLADQLWEEVERADQKDAHADEPGWERRIREVLKMDALRPVFQPIYRLEDGELVAVEALTRFYVDPHLPPDVWFTHAARVGLGVELELAAVKAALRATDSLPEAVTMTFNASPALLCDERLLALIDRHRGRPLIAEVTEHAIVDDYPRLKDSLDVLRARGVKLAVDDVGAGFASLRHIVRLEPDFIKLDLSLTQNLEHDPVRGPLADCLVQFAQRAGISMIAEGIETEADLATWTDLGAHAAQGYLLGRPGALPFPEASRVIAVNRGLPSRSSAP